MVKPMLEHMKNWLAEKLKPTTTINKRLATDVANEYAISTYKELLHKQGHKIAELEAKVAAYEAQRGNDVLADIQQLFVRQTEKGIRKYGETVKVENLSAVEWCQHALEECADNMVYLMALKKQLERGEV